MQKKTAALLLCLLTVLLATCSAFADPGIMLIGDDILSTKPVEYTTVIRMQIGEPVMTVNGEPVAIDEEGTTPMIINERTMLPVRAVIEALGGTIDWDGELRQVRMFCRNTYVVMTIGDTKAEVFYQGDNYAQLNELLIMDTAPVIRNNRTLLPIRALAETLGADVEWEAETKTVTLNFPEVKEK